ncbi:hypothetical protein [Nocardia carnea]|nr:hypothetical protein [Nocardia carnea]
MSTSVAGYGAAHSATSADTKVAATLSGAGRSCRTNRGLGRAEFVRSYG